MEWVQVKLCLREDIKGDNTSTNDLKYKTAYRLSGGKKNSSP